VNTARALAKALGERLPKCDADQMGVPRIESLPPNVRPVLEPLLKKVRRRISAAALWRASPPGLVLPAPGASGTYASTHPPRQRGVPEARRAPGFPMERPCSFLGNRGAGYAPGISRSCAAQPCCAKKGIETQIWRSLITRIRPPHRNAVSWRIATQASSELTALDGRYSRK
jgi:hypothetical protein